MRPAKDPLASRVVQTLRAAGCVFAEDEASVLIDAAADSDQLWAMVEQRVAGFPLEPIVGYADFCGLRVLVEPGVFVPRRRSGFLVQRAVSLVAPAGGVTGPASIVVVDLCCGTGALGLAIAAALAPRTVELHAADVEEAAVRCARRNLEPVGGAVHSGDLFEPLPPELRGRVDLLSANAPYVPTAAIDLMPREARLFEPLVTLDGGADGVDVHRRLAAAARDWLAPGGSILIETSGRQAGATAEAVSGNGLRVSVASSAEWDCTVVAGTRTS
ncbi:putative protein N(5)-glutamine methyltransferase [Nakamurella lactea]|uniref:putative protein N(5)-glutamine methyltransferase n=1 Tax=Nakamurella lactea TaxID=459515 RepID=UPI0003F5E61E|nr:putative protein N(5)-glutamine methyltransferase [Nakamurella lactea]